MKRFLRRIPILCLLLSLCLPSMTTSAAAGFQDVGKSHWACEAITEAAEKGFLQGNGGSFRPGEPMSLQSFVSMVCRAAGMDDRNLQSGQSWSDPALAFAVRFQWLSPQEVPNRTAPISRELAAQVLVRAFFPEQIVSEGLPSCPDRGNITPERLPYVKTALRLGLMEGFADGRFDPQGPVTRAAAAVLLQRALRLINPETPGASLQVPVLMYHDVSYLGHGYSKTPEVFRRQLEELKDAGFHTVLLSQLVDYVEKGVPLPEKPIVITLDDGYATNYTYVYPILRELDMKAEISVIGDAIRWAQWGMSWEQLREMSESGLVGVQCHTMALHSDTSGEGGRKYALKLPGESWSRYVELVAEDTETLQTLITRNVGAAPVSYAYPLGKWNTMVEGISIQMGLPVSLTTKEGVAVIRQGDPSSLRLLDRIGMDFRDGSVVSVLKKFHYRT